MDKKTAEHRKIYKEAVPFLLSWFSLNKRILPWREEPTPYHVYVSEIMLQQTRVEAVRAYYERFLKALPTLSDLASVGEEELLKLWEGLGYYSRVRNMQATAKFVETEFGGELPADYQKLLKLKGIGAYTAGAIASIAFSIRVPAVDGNVLRVMSRLASNEEDIQKEQTKKELFEDLLAVMPEEAGDFNQSLMELGALICIPNGKPLCEKCPLMHLCRAFQEGKEQQLPVKGRKLLRRKEEKLVLLVTVNGKLLLHKRDNKGLLAGLWELFSLEKNQEEKFLTKVKEVFHENVTFSNPVKAKHIFSHVEWDMTGIKLDFTGEEQEMEDKVLSFIKEWIDETTDRNQNRYVYVTEDEQRDKYSVPAAFSGILQKMNRCAESAEKE